MFGQLVIGPPGSGKSTYCHGMFQFLNAIGRKATVVNLDPANNKLPYPASIDIRDFITLEEVMEEQQLGPNGGVLFAMDQVETEVNLFVSQIKSLGTKEYLLFDCPGQVELFTAHFALRKIFKILEKKLDLRLAVVNLSDSVYLAQVNQYISIVLLSLRTMLNFGLPQVNVLSKIDLLHLHAPLPFKLDFYLEVQDLEKLVPFDDEKLQKLTMRIAEMVSDFGLVEFQVLSIENKKCMIRLLEVIDKANGYLFGSTEIGGDSVWVEATRQGGGDDVDLNDRWVENKDYWDEVERKHEQHEQSECLSEEV